MVNLHEEKCAYYKVYSKMTDYEKYLKTFGEMGVVCSTVSVKEKTEDI